MHTPPMRIALLAVAVAAAVSGLDARGEATDLRRIAAVYVQTNAPKAELDAARQLAKYLGRAAGTNIAVNPPGRPYRADAPRAVFLGKDMALESGVLSERDFDRLKWDGFAIGFKQGRVAIAGNRNTSVNNGVVELLQRTGYLFYSYSRQYLPDEPRMTFDDGVITRNPAFEFRSGGWFFYHRGTPELRGNPRQALDPELFKGSRVDATHTAGYLVPKKLYWDAHPEYYSMNQDGERALYSDSDAYVHLCMSNPDVVKIATERVLAWVRMQPDRVYFSVTQGDGHDWCQCERCLAHDVKPGVYADRMLTLLVNPIARAVAKEFPHAKIVTLAYCGTDEPPVKARPEENVYVMYCPYWGINLSEVHTFEHVLNAESERQLRGWLDIAPDNMMIYDYNMGFCPSWDAWSRKVKWYHDAGIRTGAVMCGIPLCFRDMFAYMNEQLQWDPSLDPDHLKREYVTAAYGPAAPHIMEYLDIVRERFDRGYFVGAHGATWTGFFTDGTMPRMAAAFEQALAAVEGDERRTQAIREEYNMTINTYLFHAVSPEILSEDGGARVNDDIERKPGNLTWRITEADRKCARELVARQLEQYVKEQNDLDARLAGDLPERTRTTLADQHGKLADSMRRLLSRMGPMPIPEQVDPAGVARAYLDDPAAAAARYPAAAPERVAAEVTDEGVSIPADAWRDGFGPMMYSWYCRPGRRAMIVYVPRGPRPSVMRTSFHLDTAPEGKAVLDIEGQDSQNDLLPVAQIRISINGRTVHEGDCGFVKRGWSRRTFDVPPGILKAGDNQIEVRNIYDGTQRLDGWWFALSEAKLKFK